MRHVPAFPLASIEPRLRTLLPADLYATAWVDPSPANLTRVFEHLRTLQRILYDYVPRQVAEALPDPGEMRHTWQEGTLLCTDLAGFTPFVAAHASRGRAGADALLDLLNAYFTAMIDIISAAGGSVLEFTGDALLAQFSTDRRQRDTVRAVRAGLRIQRAMARFADLETAPDPLSLGMRVGIHAGRFLTADIGTPRRMEHVLLGDAVLQTKQAEGAGQVGRVCLTDAAYARVREHFRVEAVELGYVLVVDDLTDAQLGEYDLAPARRRLASLMLLERSLDGLISTITDAVQRIEPLASYLPTPVLNLLVENAARRQLPPDFPAPTVVFVNLLGLPEAVDRAVPGEEGSVVASFSRAFALINAAVEARGGVLKKVTYHLAGSDIVIYFGVPTAHTDDPHRAVHAALAVRDLLTHLPSPTVGGAPVTVTCKIGLACGRAFAAEIGKPHGQREFNVIGDVVNTAAHLMSRAATNQILLTEAVAQAVAPHFDCEPLGPLALKGQDTPTPVFALRGPPRGPERP